MADPSHTSVPRSTFFEKLYLKTFVNQEHLLDLRNICFSNKIEEQFCPYSKSSLTLNEWKFNPSFS